MFKDHKLGWRQMNPTQAQRTQPMTNNTLFAGVMSNAVVKVAAMITAWAVHFSRDSVFIAIAGSILWRRLGSQIPTIRISYCCYSKVICR